MKTHPTILVAAMVVLPACAHAQLDLTWSPPSGAASEVWTVGGATNWLSGVTAVSFTDGDNVTFPNHVGYSGTVSVSAGGVSPGNLFFDNYNLTYTLSGGAIGGAGTLTQRGGGATVLGTTYAGGITVNHGILRTGASHVLADTAGIVLNDLYAAPSYGTLDLDGHDDTVGPITLAGGVIGTGGGTVTLNGDIAVNASAFGGGASDNAIVGNLALGTVGRSVTLAAGSNITLAASMGGVVPLAWVGSGTATLGADNRAGYSGTVQLNSGITLTLGHHGALGAGMVQLNGGILRPFGGMTGANAIANAVSVGGNISIEPLGTVEFSGPWSFAGPAAKTVSSPGATTILSGALTGSGSGAALTLEGQIELRGTNSFTSVETSGANVFVTGSTTLANGFNLTGGQLGGTGQVIGDVSATGSASSINPGVPLTDFFAALGTGNLSLGDAATLFIELSSNAAGNFDQLVVTGTVSLSLAPVLEVNDAGGPFPDGTAFTIVDNDGADPVGGTFAGLAEGAIVTGIYHSQEFTLSYTGGDGNDIVLTAQPVIITPPATGPAFVTPPQITPASGGTGAVFSAIVTGPAEATIKLEASTDLGMADAWAVISEVALAMDEESGEWTGTFTEVVDPGSVGASRNFYRLRSD